MIKKSTTKKLFIEQIRKTPIMQAACEKVGVPRGTIYRWKNEDPEFAKALDEALLEGRSMVSDAAVSQLLTAIKAGDLGAIKYWLNHFDDNFKTKIQFSGTMRHIRDDLTDEEAEVINEALKLAGFKPEELEIKDDHRSDDQKLEDINTK